MKELLLLLLPLLLFCAIDGQIEDRRETHLKNVRQLTFGGLHYSATIDPDSRYVVFAARDAKGAFGTYGHSCKQLYRLYLNETNEFPRLVSNRFGTFQSASFTHEDHKLVTSTNLRNFEPLEKTSPIRTCFGWPDDEHENAEANFDVWHLDVNRGYRPYPLTRNKRDFSSVQVAASPRQEVAFVLWEKDGGRRLMLMNTTGRLELVPLAEEFETVANPAFSPNGELLTFFGRPAKADENATQEEAGIFLLSMQNYTEITRATPLGSNWKDASFHHNGQRLFVSDGHNISYLDVGRQYLDQVTFLGHNSAPVMSPNGRFLLWTSTRNSTHGENNLFVAEWVELPPEEKSLWFEDVMKLASRA